MAFGDIVQTKQENNDGTEDPASLTFDSAVTVGNLIVFAIFTGASNLTPGTDMTEAIELLDGTNSDAIGIAYRVASTTAQTWTYDLSSADQYGAVLLEIEGPWESSPLDKTATDGPNASQSTQVSGTTATTTQNDEVAIVAASYRGSNVITPSVNNSFTVRGHQEVGSGAGTKGVVVSSRVLTTTGAYSTTTDFGLSVSYSMGVIATFKKGAGGGAASNAKLVKTWLE